MGSNKNQLTIIKDLEIYLNNLNIVAKDKLIKPFLNAFQNYLVSCGRLINSIEQPGHIYDLHLQKKLIYETDKFLKVADKLEEKLPTDSKIKIRDFFRIIVGRYLFQSHILKRFYDKPRGYAGDYLMFEMMYDAKPLSKGIGVYFDYYVFYHPIVVSVVNRKEKMKRTLKNIISRDLKDHSLVRILNVGCGGARELKELLDENIFSQSIDFTLMDQDEEGLKYAESRFRVFKKKNITFNFIQKNALEMMGFTQRRLNKNYYDVIYTLGIVDYFLDNAFARFIEYCFDLLKPNGRLIIAICSDRDMACYTALRWLSEWNFYYRDAGLTKKLIKETIGNPKVEITWEEKKQIFFIVIKKIRYS